MRKFMFISMGGMALLVIIGMVIIAVTGSHESVSDLDLAKELIWFRLAGYVLLVAVWWLLSPRLLKKEPEDAESSVEDAPEKDVSEMQGQWWKVAAFCLFFEIVIVHQLGAGSLW
tara:strand:+ start:21887 stop:22231 length:345 start_codon:yes stop_codon:yes gene_type:complete